MILGLVDQGLSSASNALVLVAFARSSGVEQFGRLALIFLILTTLLSLTRGFLGVHLVRLGGDHRRLVVEGRFAVATGILLGLTVSLVAILVCYAIGAAPAVWVLALAPPFIIWQDVLRYYSVASGRAGSAVLSDGLWCVGSVAAVVLTALSTQVSPFHISLLWVSSAAAALLVLATTVPLPPRWRGLREWMADGRAERSSFGLEGVVSALNSVAVLAVVTAILGLSATAALRGAGTIIGPLSLLMSALPLVVIPELARGGAAHDGREAWRRLRWWGLSISLLALSIGVIALVLPSSVGTALLGETWPYAQRVLPLMALEYAALAWLHAAGAGFRLLGQGRRLLSIRVLAAVSALGAAGLLALTGDVVFVAAGLALVAMGAAVVAVIVLRGVGPATN
ncbi:hypothetical protein [Actinotalea sp. K2]|uniref:hypothetical protein n=1 Tax=Actinotalea sp. K2 TaxID=2939438 RepID=UPI002017A843|nr:hypothetical protein [Actinotalea sp. K2]MCL3862915.1 hypothetical protein [Actinotalea sp. K2]